MAHKKMRTKHTVREKERSYAAPKNDLLRRKKEEVPPLSKKIRRRFKKKTRVPHFS